MPDLSIGEIAGRAGIRPSAIRYYERVGLLPKPPRASGRRRYDESILDRIAIVHFGKRVGFSLTELKILLNGAAARPPPERWRNLAHERVAQVDQLIAEASVVRQLLLETLDQKCPKLVERGLSLEPRECRACSGHEPAKSGFKRNGPENAGSAGETKFAHAYAMISAVVRVPAKCSQVSGSRHPCLRSPLAGHGQI